MPENADLRADIVRLQSDIRHIARDLAEFRSEHAEMLDAWRAGTGFFRFLKWFLTLAATAAGLWAAITQIKW